MELQKERPPAYRDHIPAPLNLPDVPPYAPAAHRRAQSSQITLPDIRSLGLPDSSRTLPSVNGYHSQPASAFQAHFPQHQWPQTPSFPSVPSHAPSPVPRQSVEVGNGAAVNHPSSQGDSVMGGFEGSGYRAPSVMSLDDAETRMAAEALSGLKNLEFMRSPSSRSNTVQTSSTMQPDLSPPAQIKQEGSPEEEQEPLLQLLTTSHPWIGGAINSTQSAYNGAKYYSPSFVRTGADFVERTIGTPIASTVGSVSRRTGIENGVRRILGERTPSDVDTNASNTKRRRTRDGEADLDIDIEKGVPSPTTVYHHRSRAGSQASFAESLPAYDTNRSPPYEETLNERTAENSTPQPQTQLATQSRMNAPSRRGSAYSWRQQLMITTSGLGVALSESSLRSLKYCLRLLQTATDHLASIMNALKSLLGEYQGAQSSGDDSAMSGTHSLTYDQQAASAAIAAKIKAMSDDIMNTLHSVVNSISTYTGGALPENASALVRRQLMSVPQRWRVANEEAAAAMDTSMNGDASHQHQQEMHGPPSPTSTVASDDALRSGTRMVQFAVQGLDMIEQVGLVLSATIRSADKWLDSMGRRGSTNTGSASGSSSSRRPSVFTAQAVDIKTPMTAGFTSPLQQSFSVNGSNVVSIDGAGQQQQQQHQFAHQIGVQNSMDTVMGDALVREKM